MHKLITGLHHVTALASDAQSNLNFYAGILGLRMVKKTINFDAPDVYHFYYGNDVGTPGTIMTFFPYQGLTRGRKGKGQLTVTAFSIPEMSVSYWMDRLDKFNIPYIDPQERFGVETVIYFEDPDGLGIELVASAGDTRSPNTFGPVPEQHSIRGFYGVTLTEEGYERTAGLLTELMDHRLVTDGSNRFRFSASGHAGDYVDIVCAPDSLRSYGGAGTVHHVAFATADDRTQLEFRTKVVTQVNPTPVLDRQYFHSIYFREPGGVLFEVATSDIGFTLDEERAHLGKLLKLPPWEERNRESIERGLVPVSMDLNQFK